MFSVALAWCALQYLRVCDQLVYSESSQATRVLVETRPARGPFWAVQGYSLFGAKAVFGSTAALFALALLAAVPLWRQLAPPNRSSGALGGAVASPLLERISTSFETYLPKERSEYSQHYPSGYISPEILASPGSRARAPPTMSKPPPLSF